MCEWRWSSRRTDSSGEISRKRFERTQFKISWINIEKNLAAEMMDTSIRFDPARRRGSILHVTVLLLLTLVVGGMLTLAILLPPGFLPVLLLVGALIMSLSLPLLFYRLYSLLQSGYWVARAGLRLRWGLRQVDLPHAAILDVARAEELENPIILPRLAWPGALLGQVQDEELGLVEFFGSELKDLVLFV